jgi:PilZ domain
MMNEDRRVLPRYEIALPVEIGATRGVTRNLSLEAVLFVSPASFDVGADIHFVIEFGQSEVMPDVQLECSGTVTRSEAEDGGDYATAAVITDLRVCALEES